MTSTHASHPLLKTLPPDLNDTFFPPSTKPEKFTPGKVVKGRNEPCAIGGVAWVVYSLLNTASDVSFEAFVETVWRNTVDVFGLVELETSAWLFYRMNEVVVYFDNLTLIHIEFRTENLLFRKSRLHQRCPGHIPPARRSCQFQKWQKFTP